MILIEGMKNYDVLAKINEETYVSYLTVVNSEEIYFFSQIEEGELKEKGTLINKINTDNDTISELPYIDKETCYKIWFEDFSSQDEREKFNVIKNQIIHDYKNNIKYSIRKDVYRTLILNSDLKLWRNKFKDEVYEVEKNKYYINDEEFDIFYEIDNKGDYSFEFIEK